MPFYDFLWTPEIEDHLAQHGISPDDFEHIVENARKIRASRSSGFRLVQGFTLDGRFVTAVFELLDDDITVIPTTAYETEH